MCPTKKIDLMCATTSSRHVGATGSKPWSTKEKRNSFLRASRSHQQSRRWHQEKEEKRRKREVWEIGNLWKFLLKSLQLKKANWLAVLQTFQSGSNRWTPDPWSNSSSPPCFSHGYLLAMLCVSIWSVGGSHDQKRLGFPYDLRRGLRRNRSRNTELPGQ